MNEDRSPTRSLTAEGLARFQTIAHQPVVVPSINQEADKIINGQRRDDYGSADESFGKIAKGWSVILGVEVSPMQVIQAMVWLKVCRATQSYTRDSYVDICGYAGLAEVLHDAEEAKHQTD